MKTLLAVFAALALSGCDAYYFHSGRFFEDTHRYLRAINSYEKFLEREHGPRAGEVEVRVADLYAQQLGRCLEARRHYEAMLRRFPHLEPWASRAQAGLMACPDYFPLESGKELVYGDSASGGRNMRLEWQVKASSGAAGEVSSRLYAGKKEIRSVREIYEKRDWAVWQKAGADTVPILRFPYYPGSTWSARRSDGSITWLIESDHEKVKVHAGVFENCLKVRETNRRFPKSWKYDYYAPGVGRVKTSVGAPGIEAPNTELMKFDKI